MNVGQRVNHSMIQMVSLTRTLAIVWLGVPFAPLTAALTRAAASRVIMSKVGTDNELLLTHI